MLSMEFTIIAAGARLFIFTDELSANRKPGALQKR
jgi:hypothetical protein